MRKKTLLKKILSCTLISSLIFTTGCSFTKKEEPAPIVYALTPISEAELQQGKYYVKNADSFYELPMGIVSFDENNMVAKNADKARTILFGENDVCIPTLYRDDTLVYVTNVLPDSFTWERYYDDGYSFGFCGLSLSNTNQYVLTMKENQTNKSSSFLATAAQYPELGWDSQLVINAINSSTLGAGNVSDCGSILGLTYMGNYNIDAYGGSTYYPLQGVVADTHVFHSYELYTTTVCNYTQANYMQVVVPDYLFSGYYLIDGIGFVKYVNNYRNQGQAGIDMNAPYYLYDEDGNVYTADTTTTTEDGTIVSEIDEDVFFSNSIYLDCSNQRMNITVKYDQAKRKNADGSDIYLSDEEVGTPEIKLYSPDEEEFIFTNSNKEENAMTCSIENPVPGQWRLKLWNMTDRRFDTDVQLVSGHSDTLYHSGTGKGTFDYYLSKNLTNSFIKVTWSDLNKMPSELVIKNPNGDDITRDVVGDENYEEGRGYAIFKLNDIPYGNYNITISGDSLGRVRAIFDGDKINDDELSDEVSDNENDTAETTASGDSEDEEDNMGDTEEPQKKNVLN